MEKSSLSLTLDKNLIDNSIKGEIISNLQIILKLIVEDSLKHPIKYVDVLETEIFLIFTPYTEDSLLYKENFSEFISSFDFSYILGYTLLSTSNLARYLIDKWVDEKLYNLTDLNVKYYKDISLIPISNPYKDDLIFKLDRNISKMISDGYFTYDFGIHEIENIGLVRELCNAFNINIINSKDLSRMICRTDIDFTVSPETWIRENISLIREGLFPSFSFSFDFSFYNDYIRLYGSQFKDVILEYISYLAFAEISDKHPLIKPFITKIRINEDFSITVYLPNYQLVKLFKNKVEQYLNEGITYENNGKLSGIWNKESCSDLNEGIIKRWIIQQIDSNAYPMIFKDKNNNEILVHRSPLAIKYPSPFIFNVENIERGRESLLKELRKFYSTRKVCHDNMEPVFLENIDEMELNELLRLISVNENDIIYCFKDETISKLENKINPLTRRPFNEKTLENVKYLENGLRGLFDVGVLFGLYEEVPSKPDISNNTGIIKISREAVDIKRKDLVGNIFLVEVLFEDGTSSPLFEISLPIIFGDSITKLTEYVDKLWYNGYFLNYWTSGLVLYMKNMKSFETIVTSPIFLHASSSIFDGNIAFDHLENASENISEKIF